MVVSQRASDAMLYLDAVGRLGVCSDVEAQACASYGWQHQQQLKRDEAPD